MLSEVAFAAKQHWGYSVEWMEAWREELTATPEYLHAQPVYVATEEGRIAGFFGLKSAADGHHLEHLWLLPAFIGRGLGRALFGEAVQQARPAGATELRIKSDPNAEGFYLKMGAVRTGLEESLFLGRFRREVPLLVYSLRCVAEITLGSEA